MSNVTSRKLRARTVLPDDLYVLRNADRQLALIVEDMGRPGYVLVARQMGKTNLLLHMKRERESSGDIVIYIDLSQRFESARACFRYIIDLAIDTNPDRFDEGVRSQISADRSIGGYDPSLEYTRNLRSLLKSNPDKKLIIVLDEIDSLVNAAYSDTVLAHIRSTYFVRTNYPEFERLTYVLSGVAEPSDLIKDKNISPFNIGEKIYLDDFSRDEFKSFLINVNLTVGSEIADRVYHWSHGNPRITWDICAAIEERLSGTATISSADVDEIVHHLYLATFDRPPVDHIRVLVESDAALRAALISMRYGKAGSIDGRLRSRLYLAGITRDAGAEPQIRNLVVDAALSDAWLAQIDASRSNPATLATEHYIGQRYQQAKELFEKVKLSGNTLSPSQSVTLGLTLYHMRLYEESAEELSSVITKLRGENRTNAEYHLGSSYILLGKPKEAFSVLNNAARAGSGVYRFPSEILLAAANYQVGSEVDNDLRISSKHMIISAASEESVGSELGDATVVPALIYSVAYAAMSVEANDDAIDYLDCAATVAPPGLIPTILITKFAITADDVVKVNLAISAATAIIENQLHPVTHQPGLAAYTERSLLAVLTALLTCNEVSKLRELVAFVVSNEKYRGSEVRFLSELFIRLSSFQMLDKHTVPKMLLAVGGTDVDTEDMIAIARARLVHATGEEKAVEVQGLLKAATFTDGFRLTDEDVGQIVSVCQYLLTNSGFRKVADIISAAEPFMSDDVSATWQFIFFYYKMTVLENVGERVKTRSAAIKILDIHSRVESEEVEAIAEFVATVVDHARKTLSLPLPIEPDEYRNIGRNQKVIVSDEGKDQLKPVKFKTVEQDVRDGKVKIIRVLPRK